MAKVLYALEFDFPDDATQVQFMVLRTEVQNMAQRLVEPLTGVNLVRTSITTHPALIEAVYAAMGLNPADFAPGRVPDPYPLDALGIKWDPAITPHSGEPVRHIEPVHDIHWMRAHVARTPCEYEVGEEGTGRISGTDLLAFWEGQADAMVLTEDVVLNRWIEGENHQLLDYEPDRLEDVPVYDDPQDV